MSIFNIPRNKAGRGEEAASTLWDAVLDLADDIEAFFSVTIHDVLIGTDETVVAHGQKYTPSICIPVAQSNATVWRTRESDDRFCYFAASSAVTCDIRVMR